MTFVRDLRRIGLRIHGQTRTRVNRILNKPRRINLIGWHGNGATGDDLLGFCVKKLLNSTALEFGVPLDFEESKKPDLIVVSGGTLLGLDSMGIYDLVVHSRSPLVFFGGGFRREQRQLPLIYQQRFRELADKAILKGTRGYVSQQMFIQNGISDFEVIGDPAFQFEKTETFHLPGRFKVGVVVRSMGKTGEPQYVPNEQMHSIIAEICDHLVAAHDAELYFFDFAENPQDSDTEGAQRVIAQMRCTPRTRTALPMEHDPIRAFSVIDQMNYMVSQRLHPTMVAWLLGKPCVALDYQFLKVADFMGSIGMGEFVIRTDEYHLDVYESQFRRIVAERDLIIDHSQRSFAYWRQRQRDFAERTICLVR